MTETDNTDTNKQMEGLLEQNLNQRQSEPSLQAGEECFCPV